MIKALNTAASGMAAQESNVNTISNNIANVNTNGFKKSRTEFEDLLYENIQEAGARSNQNSSYSVGIQSGNGSKVAGVRKIHTKGAPKVTNNAYDFMINGNGFFGIILPNGELRFTRNGSFSVDSTGNLTTKAGYRIFPGVTIPNSTTHLNVSEDGKVQAFEEGKTTPVELGEIPVFTFINPVGLRSEGGNLFAVTAGSGEPIQNTAGQNNSGNVKQGMLESSNVQIMNEMTDLIKAQRAYEMNAKVMSIADQMMQTVNNVK